MTEEIQKPTDQRGDSSVESTYLLALRIRSLIADKELVTARANRDLQVGIDWCQDYHEWHRQIDTEINALLSEANVERRCAAEKQQDQSNEY